jgi:hypothetical protein
MNLNSSTAATSGDSFTVAVRWLRSDFFLNIVPLLGRFGGLFCQPGGNQSAQNNLSSHDQVFHNDHRALWVSSGNQISWRMLDHSLNQHTVYHG